jgi:hypothetical protein
MPAQSAPAAAAVGAPRVAVPQAAKPAFTPSGIPAPIFGKSKPPEPSGPFATAPAQAAPARPAAIRIEMGEEVMEARRQGRTKIMWLCAASAVVGGVLGYAIGGGAARNAAAQTAVTGAQELIKEIEAANAQANELGEVLKAAGTKLQQGKFPAEEVSKLGEIRIAFGGQNLWGKGIGRYKQDVQNQLFSYVTAATEANESKEKLQNVLSAGRAGVEEFLARKANPKIRWSVYVSNGPLGPWATMQALPEAFPVADKTKQNYAWPNSFKFKDGDKVVDMSRYEKGKVIGTDPLLIPVDPESETAVCPTDMLFKLGRELRNVHESLQGSKVAGHEKDGIVDVGTKLVDQLKKIGAGAAEGAS